MPGKDQIQVGGYKYKGLLCNVNEEVSVNLYCNKYSNRTTSLTMTLMLSLKSQEMYTALKHRLEHLYYQECLVKGWIKHIGLL